MPLEEIKCSLCGLRKSIDDFSKNSRKLADSACKRCVAWTETQEPGIVPAPLETGHVSIEEYSIDHWGDEPKTGEDFFDDDLRPQAPITSRAELGLEGDDPVDVDAILAQTSQLDMSETQSIASTAPSTAYSTLPPHLRTKARSVATSESGDSTVSELPPHLRSRAPSSISTATTVRQSRDDKAKARLAQYVAYGPDGTQQVRTRMPSKATSSALSDTSRDTSSVLPAQPSRAAAWPSKSPHEPRPERQIDVNPVPYRGVNKPDSGVDYQRRLGFCNSDDDDDDCHSD